MHDLIKNKTKLMVSKRHRNVDPDCEICVFLFGLNPAHAVTRIGLVTNKGEMVLVLPRSIGIQLC